MFKNHHRLLRGVPSVLTGLVIGLLIVAPAQAQPARAQSAKGQPAKEQRAKEQPASGQPAPGQSAATDTPPPGRPASCTACPAPWRQPREPFRIYGNAYYVGMQGLSSILITSSDGHVLIDGALPESPASIVASIRALGFRVEDVKLIVNSHVHFDHAGGIAELQRLSGATVAASERSAPVLRHGGVGRDDPQAASLPPIAAVAQVKTVKDGETLHVGPIALTAHLTPGHTPGGTSWSWQSCERSRCVNIVYADSLSAISSEGFLYTRHPPVLKGFEQAFTVLSTVPCDIRLTPHPEGSDLFGKLEKRERGGDPHAFIDPTACRAYADSGREGLRTRVAEENARAPRD